MRNSVKYIFVALLATFMATTALSAQTYAGLKAFKTAVDNHDGTYTLSLDTFVTGEETTTVEQVRTPLDAVLVLDVSGSMAEVLTTTTVYSYNADEKKLSSLYTQQLTKTFYVLVGDGEYKSITVSWAGGAGKNTKYTVRTEDGVYDGLDAVTDQKITVYTKTSTEVETTRLDALKTAVKSFIQTVYNDEVNYNADKPVDKQIHHRISIVKFSGYYDDSQSATVVTLANGAVLTNKSNLESAVDALRARGATYADEGMDLAKTEYDNSAREGASKVVVFFTDGEPGEYGFEDSRASAAINSSKAIKDLGGKVFAVTVVNITSGSDQDKFMNYISSNYPQATSMDNPGTPVNGQYFSIATDADALNQVFSSIAKDATSGGASEKIDVTKTEIRDIITDSFQLPEGATADNIKLYEQELDKVENGVYTFKSELLTTTAQFSVSDDNKTVTVKGFDFAAHWCGKKDDKGTVTYVGRKIVIKITIVPDPDSEGGAVFTNDSKSGIYMDGQLTVKYPVPPKVYAPREMIISKSGLKAGESAIFVITRAGKDGEVFSMTVCATCFEAGKDAVVKVKLPVDFYENNTVTDYTYTVTEDAGWGWAYDATTAVTQKLKDDNEYKFSATNEKSILHSEAASQNNFKIQGQATEE